MKKLLKYMKDYKKESVLGPLFKLLEASFEPVSYTHLIPASQGKREGEQVI